MDWSHEMQIEGDMAIQNVIGENGWFYALPHHPALIAAQDIMMDELSAAGADEIDAQTAVDNIIARLEKVIK